MKNTAARIQMGFMISFYNFIFYSPSLNPKDLYFLNRSLMGIGAHSMLAEIHGIWGSVRLRAGKGVVSVTWAPHTQVHTWWPFLKKEKDTHF